MKILFLTDNFPPEVNAPATRTYEHCLEWVKLGAEITVITCFPNFPKGKIYQGYKNDWKRIENISGIKVIRVWSYITSNEGFFKRTLDYISFSITSFIIGYFVETDIIIATSPQFFTALCGRALSFWKRKPWIMEVRDLWPESIKVVGASSNKYILNYFERQEIRCYKSALKIIVVTDSFKENLIRKGINKEKIKVITNGANLDLYQPIEKNKQIINELGLGGKKILGYVGTHGLAHKLTFILDCAKQLLNQNTEFHFILIGDGAEKKALQERVTIDNLTNVTMLDSVSKENVVEFLSILDAAIINLRKSELFTTVIPSKIFETAAMEIPILLGVNGEARNIIEKYNAGLFYEPENIDDFIDKLNLLFSNLKVYNQYKKGCQKLALSYNRKILASKMYLEVQTCLNK